ncbi:MAG: hypothetical protein MJ250_02945 [Alphaproteobacteria bacterium]|nr:hypothetical protein [Alphaproteobacteria bacterium]
MASLLQQEFGKTTDENAVRLEKLKELIKTTSPTGKKVLEDAEKNNIEINFDSLGNFNGMYVPNLKTVILNQDVSDHVLATTLIHEIQHSKQVLNRETENTIFSNIAIERAGEADAMAVQAAVAYEMGLYIQNRRSNPDYIPTIGGAALYASSAFEEAHSKIFNAYRFSMKKNDNLDLAKNSAFKAWYKDKDYVNKYDQRVVESASLSLFNRKAFTKNPSPVDLYPDFNYIEPAFFKSKEATTLPEDLVKQAASIERFNIRNMFKLFSKNATVSADNFYTEKPDGTIVPPKKQTTIRTKLLDKQAQR